MPKVRLVFDVQVPATSGPVTWLIEDMTQAAEGRGCKVAPPVKVEPADRLRLIEGGKDTNDAA